MARARGGGSTRQSTWTSWPGETLAPTRTASRAYASRRSSCFTGVDTQRGRARKEERRRRTARVGAWRSRLVAPVEVARLAPETLALFGLGLGLGLGHRGRRVGLLAGPGHGRGLERDGGLAVHRLLEPGLLLGLDQRVVLERILGLVVVERHVAVEVGVAALQVEVVLDHACEERRGLDGHEFLPPRGRDMVRLGIVSDGLFHFPCNRQF